MGNILPNDHTIAPTTSNRRDFLKRTGTIAGLTSAGAFTQLLLPGGTAEAQYTPTPKPMITTPNKYDLRSVGVAGTNFITEVRDQGICNACTAYAVVGAIEGAISVKTGTSNPQLHLSEEQLFSCAGPGCDTNAWYPADALAYCQNFGVANYAGYGPRDGVCHADPNASPVKISSYQKLADASTMKQCISGTGAFTQSSPVVSLFVFYQDLWDWAPSSDNKVYKHKDNGNPHEEARIGGHAVCIVGYNDAPGYWICKNSWGPGWGGAGKGYFNMSYGDCHIDDFQMYGVVPL
jgi:C1A family cysteine protease